MKTIYVLALLISFCSCNSKRKNEVEISKDSITAYLKNSLNDPSSYQPIFFSKMDTVLTQLEDDNKYYSYKELTDTNMFITNDIIRNFQLYKKRKKVKYYDSLYNAGIKGVDSCKKAFKPKLNYYAIVHSYRAKNGFGALTIHNTLFHLKSNLSVFYAKEEK